MPAAYIRLWTLIFLGLLSPLEVTSLKVQQQYPTAKTLVVVTVYARTILYSFVLVMKDGALTLDLAEYKAPDCSLQNLPRC